MALQPTLELTDFTFNAAHLKKRVERGQRSAMIGQLALLRRKSRQSIKRTKKPSAPGQPVRAHAPGNTGMKLILFRYYDGPGYGVVGPVRLPTRARLSRNQTTVPNTLEAGGKVQVQQELKGRQWVIARFIVNRYRRPRRWRGIRIAKRPTMMLTLQQEVDNGNIMQPWVGAIHD